MFLRARLLVPSVLHWRTVHSRVVCNVGTGPCTQAACHFSPTEETGFFIQLSTLLLTYTADPLQPNLDNPPSRLSTKTGLHKRGSIVGVRQYAVALDDSNLRRKSIGASRLKDMLLPT